MKQQQTKEQKENNQKQQEKSVARNANLISKDRRAFASTAGA